MADGYGCAIVKNEGEVNVYRDGYAIEKAQINKEGTLYCINKTLNQIEVFYGAHTRSGPGRPPDFIYDEYSTPPIFGGEILDLFISPEASVVAEGRTRFYVGTTQGATKVDTNDKVSDSMPGFPAGLDGYGMSKTYGIVGSGAQFEVLGGTIARTVEVAADEDRLVMLVGASDGYGGGGITQVSLEGDRKILFMTKELGLIPDNTITDIFGKGF